MGRTRSPATAHLPPGLLMRRRGSTVHYYLSRPNGDRREEVPLGNLLDQALAEYQTLRPVQQQPITEATARELFVRCRKGARQRGLEFGLALEDVQTLLAASGGCCAVTGIPFDLTRPAGQRKRLWAPSVDRIESGAGYVSGNVRVVAIAVNIAMSDFGEEFLLRIAHALIRKRRRSA